MKLVPLKTGRDGMLILVSKDMTYMALVNHITTYMTC